MKVARLCQASRTVHGEASRKTWQDDVEQGSGIQAVDSKGCAGLVRRETYYHKTSGNATDIRRRERVTRHLSAR